MKDFDAYRHERALHRCARELEQTYGCMPTGLDLDPLSRDALEALEKAIVVVRGALRAARKYARLVDGAEAKVPEGADRLTRAIIMATGKRLPRKLDLAPLGEPSRNALAAIFEQKRADVMEAKAKLKAREEAKRAKLAAEATGDVKTGAAKMKAREDAWRAQTAAKLGKKKRGD